MNPLIEGTHARIHQVQAPVSGSRFAIPAQNDTHFIWLFGLAGLAEALVTGKCSKCFGGICSR